MVEVLVAFAMVLFVLAAFARTVTVSARLLSQSKLVQQANEELNRSYYQETEGSIQRKCLRRFVSHPVSDRQWNTGVVEIIEKQAGAVYKRRCRYALLRSADSVRWRIDEKRETAEENPKME